MTSNTTVAVAMAAHDCRATARDAGRIHRIDASTPSGNNTAIATYALERRCKISSNASTAARRRLDTVMAERKMISGKYCNTPYVGMQGLWLHRVQRVMRKALAAMHPANSEPVQRTTTRCSIHTVSVSDPSQV